MPEVMARTQQHQQLLAWPRAAVAVKGDVMQSVFPLDRRDGLDNELFGSRFLGFGAVLDAIDDERDVAALDNVMSSERPVGDAQALAVQGGAVGAAQVTYAPDMTCRVNLGVLPAHGAFVEHNFQRLLAADAQPGRRFPGILPVSSINHAKADRPLHATLL